MSGAYLAVARVRKPHGLKGEVFVWSLTDDPAEVFRPGRVLTPLDEEGRSMGAPITIERSRPYHRHWLLKFEGLDDRSAVEAWGQRVVGVAADELAPPGEDELYVHEVPGAAVVVGGERVGTARELLETPAGAMLSVTVGAREVLVPFRRPIVKRVDRAAREIELDPPAGLLEL